MYVWDMYVEACNVCMRYVHRWMYNAIQCMYEIYILWMYVDMLCMYEIYMLMQAMYVWDMYMDECTLACNVYIWYVCCKWLMCKVRP